MKHLIFMLGIIITATSCTNNLAISKRKYRKGFYHNLNTFPKDITPEVGSKSDSTQKTITITKLNGDVIAALMVSLDDQQLKYRKQNNPTGPLYILNLDQIKSIESQNGEALYGNYQNEADTLGPFTNSDKKQTLITEAGDSISVMIESIDQEEIKYKNANNLSGPSYTKDTKNVEQVIDANGNQLYSDRIEKSKTQPEKGDIRTDDFYGKYSEENYSEDILHQNPNAIVSFVFGIISLALLILGGIGLTWGIISAINAQGLNGVAFIILGLFAAIALWIQSLVAGIVAFINGVIGTHAIYNKKNKKYKKDPKAIFGLASGILVIMGFLASLLLVIVGNL